MPLGNVGPPFFAPGGMNPQGLFPNFTPGPSSIDTTYAPDGSVKTVTQAPGMPFSSGPYQQLAAMMGGPAQQAPKNNRGARSKDTRGTIKPAMQSIGGKSTTVETPWYTAQGAAMRPVGLGPAQIPGMGIDPRFLPPHMRPKESQFQADPQALQKQDQAFKSQEADKQRAHEKGLVNQQRNDEEGSVERRWFQQFGSTPPWMERK